MFYWKFPTDWRLVPQSMTPDKDDDTAHPIADVLLEFTHALTHQAIVSRGLFPSSRARSTLYGARTCVIERQDVIDYLNDVFATLRVALSRYECRLRD